MDIAIFLDEFEENEIIAIINYWKLAIDYVIAADNKNSIPFIGTMIDYNKEESPFRSAIIDYDVVKKIIEEDIIHFSLDSPVLLTGSTGSGKTFFAKFMTENILGKKLHTQNLAALGTGNLFRSELHGHAKGSYSGATKSRLGMYKTAKEQVLLLDELEGLDECQQIELLNDFDASGNVIVKPLGSDECSCIKLSLIFATNADIKKKIKKGEFRKDFLYRITQIIKFSDLHDVFKEEPNRLIKYILFFVMKHRGSFSSFATESSATSIKTDNDAKKIDNDAKYRRVKKEYFFSVSKETFELHDEQINKLYKFKWQGNFRQIETFCTSLIRKFEIEGREEFTISDPKVVNNFISTQNLFDDSDDDESIEVHIPRNERLDEMGKNLKDKYVNLLTTALIQTEGKTTEAARKLGMKPETLNRKLKHLGINPQDYKPDGGKKW